MAHPAERILIIGGGTGGTMLANALSPRHFEVTVVTASPQHMFQPALLYVAFDHAGVGISRNEAHLLRRHVRLVHGAVAEIDLREKRVALADGQPLGYDRIVVATGITTDPGQIPGLQQVNETYGDYHSTPEQARKLRDKFAEFEGGTLVLGQSSPVCKCPPSPVEGILLADQLLRRRGIRHRTRLVFVTPYPRAYSAAGMNEVVEPLLRERNIEIRTFFDVDRIDPDSRTITSIEGEDIGYDLPILIPPFVGADIAYTPADVLDDDRFVRTDRHTLRIQDADGAFAIGDATNLPTSKSGVGAHLQAQVVARALSGQPAEFTGRTHCPLDTGDGRGTFVTGTYTAPVVKAAPSRTKHLMKKTFGRVYWMSLRGRLEPVMREYFRLTEPPEAAAPARSAPPAEPDPERRYNQPEEFRHVVAASRKRLFAVFDDPERGVAAVGALRAGDLDSTRETWLLYGEEGLRRLDAAGTGHGVYGHVVRGLQRVMSDDSRYLDALESALEDGALVVSLPIADIETADRVAGELQGGSGHTFAYTAHMDFVPTAGEI